MGTGLGDGWEGGVRWEGWRDHRDIRRRLEQGADPEALPGGGRPLHRAVVFGSPEVVAELAGRVADVDVLQGGTTALWEAVVAHRPEIARVLVAAGADPWRPVLADWSPGRLSLAGPTPGLFELPEGEQGLSEAQSEAARDGRRRIAALADVGYYDGTGLACVAGIDAQEAVRRLAAGSPDAGLLAQLLDDPYDADTDDSLRIVGVTTVPGGCVVTQPWGYGPQMPGVQALLSAGTVCYGMYANPKSGNQGSLVRDGVVEGWDLHPGGGPWTGMPPEEVLTAYIYGSHAIAECCARAGLFPADPRPFTGSPDLWVELPERDYWQH
ncbi:ankyrin repeat domain-containing protein [Streptomyces longwoodensis]|uniref:ankyrin repeat domain-containing protein n=1 Tax=Streptomyces longwoodensis TaxID=68231 RepID=UPI0033C55992